jgi:hypothetical protein
MNENILSAIESICEDIASSSDADENKTRAEAIALLVACNIVAPTAATGILLTEEETSDSGEAPASVKRSIRPNPGEHFVYNGIDHVILGEEQGGILAIRANALDEEKKFDVNNKNDWRVSSLRVDLNESYIKQYNKGDLLPFTSDLTADNGDKSYGTCKDYIFILSCDLLRKYRDYLPKFKTDDIVTLTPWTCGTNAYVVRYLYADGDLYNDYAYNSYGVAPACLFNPSIFE